MKKYFVLSLVLLVLAAPACKPPSSANGDTSQSKETAPDTSDPNAKAAFLKAARKFIELPSVTARADWVRTYGGKELTNSQQLDYIAPNRFRTKWLVKLGEPDQLEYIGIAKTVYAKTCWLCPGGAKWVKFSEGVELNSLRDPFTEKCLRRLSDVKYEGEDTIDGRKTSVYSYKNQVFMPLLDEGDYMTRSSCKIWIRQDKEVPLKLHAEFSDSSVKSLDIVFDVETSVKIEAPAVSE